jgi:hypothetical protein
VVAHFLHAVGRIPGRQDVSAMLNLDCSARSASGHPAAHTNLGLPISYLAELEYSYEPPIALTLPFLFLVDYRASHGATLYLPYSQGAPKNLHLIPNPHIE